MTASRGFKGRWLQIIGALGVTMAVAAWAITVQPVLYPVQQVTPATISAASLRQDVERLANDFAKRNHSRPALLGRVAGYIENRFREAGAQVEVVAYQVEGATFHNVVARFGPAGTDPVVIGAHYDVEEHTAGADDNASGVAGLLAIADHLGRKPPEVPVELVAYCLEEPPYFRTESMGSRQHAKALRAAGRSPRLVVVLEMIGYFSAQAGSQRFPLQPLGWFYPDRGDFIAVVGDYSSVGSLRRVKQAMRSANTIPVQSITAPAWVHGVDFSDHASYWAEGIPAVMVTDTAFFRNPNYHEPGDLSATLDYERMAAVVHALIQVVHAAQGPA